MIYLVTEYASGGEIFGKGVPHYSFVVDKLSPCVCFCFSRCACLLSDF